jgi:hypothetical protein
MRGQSEVWAGSSGDPRENARETARAFKRQRLPIGFGPATTTTPDDRAWELPDDNRRRTKTTAGTTKDTPAKPPNDQRTPTNAERTRTPTRRSAAAAATAARRMPRRTNACERRTPIRGTVKPGRRAYSLRGRHGIQELFFRVVTARMRCR